MNSTLDISESRKSLGILLGGIGLILIGLGLICRSAVDLIQSRYLANRHRDALIEAVHSINLEKQPSTMDKPR